MLPFSFKSTFSFTGDVTATLNTLTNVENVDATKTLETLSSKNYIGAQPNPSNPNRNPIKPNPDNQLVFMNQPMSWWLENLASGAIHYLPYSNYVNWGYKMETGDVVHIDMDISNLLIPNRSVSSSKDSTTNITTVLFESKFGMERKDTHTM